MCALSDRFWYSKQIKPGTGWNISLFNRGLCGWHRQNVTHTRSNRFLRRIQNCPQWLFCRPSQNPSEPVDTFIQDLYCLAEKCEYRTLRDELIRDRIIAGVLDDALSDRPQAGFDLILTDAACMSRQTEARKPNRTICPWVRNSKRSWSDGWNSCWKHHSSSSAVWNCHKLWKSSPMDPWPLSEKVLFSNP